MIRFFVILLPLLFLTVSSLLVRAQGVLTFEDVMKFEDLNSPSISSNGNWISYGVWPDRGDGKVVVQHISNGTEYEIELGSNPVISFDESWVVAYKSVSLVDQLKAKKDKPKRGLALLNLSNGATQEFDSVSTYQLSNDGKWLAIKNYQSKEIEDLKHKNKKLGTAVTLWDLDKNESLSLDFVSEMSFDSLSNYFSYSVIDTSGEGNGLYVYDLEVVEKGIISTSENGFYSNLIWDPKRPRIAFTKAALDSSYKEGDASLHLWDEKKGNLQTLVKPEDTSEDWALRSKNRLTFTHDGKRLFFGLMHQDMVNLDNKSKDEEDEEIDIYDVESIVEDRGMDLWHGEDPRIKTHEIVTFNSRKARTYTAVYHLDKKRWVQLADLEMPFIRVTHNKDRVMGSSDEPYLRDITHEGFFQDWYVVDLQKGTRVKVNERTSNGASVLSPDSKSVVYYHNKDWHAFDVKSGKTTNLTENLGVPFYNEDHDYPSQVPGYGTAGWVESGKWVLINDKYDVWQVPLGKGDAFRITNGDGREVNRIFRIRTLGNGNNFGKNEELLLTSYHDLKKNFGFYSAQIGKSGIQQLLEEDKKFTFVAKAEDSGQILYKREAYDEFPNLWVTDNWKFNSMNQVSELHMDLKEKWNWGKAELIDWLSLDGTSIQGVVIKPDNYDPNKRYPIMTYYYRFFTNRLHDFNEPKTNHRPVFAQYTSDDYVVFLPDIRFEIGRPGFAATKSLVPGIQKLIEMGIADEDKLGLHGHSWSGYQTAFIVTQTDIFDAAVSGAPVSNMTSAYSGIRWASGLARQFQYEKTQSRIGESLIGAPEKYIENSPVFFADKITTPMLIQHGDADGAVPWYQSIEMYLAMRRYNKDVVFLQYHDEPHHLQKFPNKLDYAIRMKEYFDYYLKGIGEPEWILNGEVYIGK
ncbi:MAG: prolyl oligopeptidase family serine peptidase [Balneolaceae bacterium]